MKNFKKSRLFIFVLLLSFMMVLTYAVGCAPEEEPAEVEVDEDVDVGIEEVEGEPIVFAVPTALGSIEGRDGLMAVQLAASEINEAGGVNVGGEMRPIKVVSIDTREHEPGIPIHDALAALERIIERDEPHAIVMGAFRSEVLLASMDLIERYKIPYMTTIAMTPEFEQRIAENYDSYKYMFRNCLNSPYLVRYLMSLMDYLNTEFGFTKASILVQDVLWAQATGNMLADWFEENGWEVVGKSAYPTGSSDFSSSLAEARRGGAEVIVPVFDMPPSGILARQAVEMQVPALMAGFISPAAPQNAWDVFEGELDYLINFIFEIGPLPVEAVPRSVEFNEAFGQFHGEAAQASLSGHGPGPSYDAVYILAEAIERAGTLDADAVVAEIKETDMEGAVGRVRFDENHQAVYGDDPAEASLGAAFQWIEGERVPVFPEIIAEDSIQLPPYMQ